MSGRRVLQRPSAYVRVIERAAALVDKPLCWPCHPTGADQVGAAAAAGLQRAPQIDVAGAHQGVHRGSAHPRSSSACRQRQLAHPLTHFPFARQANADMLGWELTADDVAVINGFAHQQRMARNPPAPASRWRHFTVVDAGSSSLLTPSNTRPVQVHGSMWLQKEGPYRTMEELWDEPELA